MLRGAEEGEEERVEPFRCGYEQVQRHDEIRRVHYQGARFLRLACATELRV